MSVEIHIEARGRCGRCEAVMDVELDFEAEPPHDDYEFRDVVLLRLPPCPACGGPVERIDPRLEQ